MEYQRINKFADIFNIPYLERNYSLAPCIDALDADTWRIRHDGEETINLQYGSE